MATLQINLSDRLKSLAQERAVEEGFESVDAYLANLIEADQVLPVAPELEAELLRGLKGEGREMTDEDWERKTQQLRARFGQRSSDAP